jgi:hypothetical protein
MEYGSTFRGGIGGFAGRFKVVPFAAKVALYLYHSWMNNYKRWARLLVSQFDLDPVFDVHGKCSLQGVLSGF